MDSRSLPLNTRCWEPKEESTAFTPCFWGILLGNRVLCPLGLFRFGLSKEQPVLVSALAMGLKKDSLHALRLSLSLSPVHIPG